MVRGVVHRVMNRSMCGAVDGVPCRVRKVVGYAVVRGMGPIMRMHAEMRTRVARRPGHMGATPTSPKMAAAHMRSSVMAAAPAAMMICGCCRKRDETGKSKCGYDKAVHRRCSYGPARETV
jgi:hypothetical protein